MTAAIWPLQFDGNALEKKRAGECVTTQPGSKPKRPSVEDIMRSADSRYTESSAFCNGERLQNWQAVGDLARKLVLDMAERKAKEKDKGGQT